MTQHVPLLRNFEDKHLSLVVPCNEQAAILPDSARGAVVAEGLDDLSRIFPTSNFAPIIEPNEICFGILFAVEGEIAPPRTVFVDRPRQTSSLAPKSLKVSRTIFSGSRIRISLRSGFSGKFECAQYILPSRKNPVLR